MKLLIVVSMSITDFDLSTYINERVDIIICRGSKGIESLVEKYADNSDLSKLIMRPNYKRYGEDAPLIRDKQMVDISDYILVIWDGKSQEISNIIRFANEYEKPIQILLHH